MTMFSSEPKLGATSVRRGGAVLVAALLTWLGAGEGLFAAFAVKTNIIGVTPTILGYNSGHFYTGSNTREWWRYAGVSGARVFINPNDIEPTAGTTSGGVASSTTYSNRLAAVRANPTSGTYIGWSFTNNYASTLSGNNSIVPKYAFGALRQLGVQILVNITSSFSLSGATDWANKWKIWRHYYAQAFYLSRTFDVQRYQMYNEPNYGSPAAITESEFFLQLQVASDAIQSAIADVNRLYGKSLTPLVLAPVTSGSADGPYTGYGDGVVTNRHLNQYSVVDPNFSVIQKYDYHQYDGAPTTFGSSLATLCSLISGDMSPETSYPVSCSEFNVYTGATYDTKTNTLDSPTDYARFGDIAANLLYNTIDEAYCFKFSQTTDSSGSGIAKNGMLYVENSTSPYNIGGITKAGEAWRLFNKGMGAGQNRFGGTPYHLSYDPVANRYYIYAANNSAGMAILSVNLAAWNIPTNNLVLFEEVSESCYGAVKFTTNVSSAEIVGGFMPAYSVWLLTIPAGAQNPVQTLTATDDAMVRDGIYTNTNFGVVTNVLVQNSSATRNNRSVGLLKFHLPAGFAATNLQLAVLSLHAASSVDGATSQAHVYGLASTNWTEAAVKWNNAPNLKQGASAGTGIPNNFVLGVGDWTNSTVPAASSAQLLGQVVADTNYTERLVDVTDFLKRATNADVSFLLAREVRFNGDLATDDGISIISTESDVTSAPQLKLVFDLPLTSPVISQDPQSISVTNGSAAGFSVTAAGADPLSYQWRKGGGVVADATNAALNFASVSTNDAGNYDVVVTNGFGSITSAPATLTVVLPAPPGIAQQPQSVTTNAGAAVAFSVTATGSAPLAYQWRFGGSPISNGTNTTYTLAAATTNNAGNYDVIVTNSSGTVTSSVAVLTVTAPSAGDVGSVVIAEIYPGGGKSVATYSFDYVVLKNISAVPVNMVNWSLQYDKGGVWQTPLVLANVTLPAGGYYLIQCYNDGSVLGGASLPTPDAVTAQSSAWNLSTSTAAAVALVTNTTTLTSCSSSGIVDLVGWVTNSGNCYQGTGIATNGSATQAIQRKNIGCQSTGDNTSDFTQASPSPKNSASAVALCAVAAPAPAKLAFATQPANTNAGSILSGIVVQLADAGGNAVTNGGTNVTLSLNGGSFAGGTQTQLTDGTGRATFADLVISAAGSYTLTASATGLTPTNSAVFAIVTSPQLASPMILTNGSLKLTFSNAPGASFTMLGTTNLALPSSNWTVLGLLSESPAGQYQFTDPQAKTNSYRYYKVRSP